MDAEQPEDQPAERALDDRHDDPAFDRRADHRRELRAELALQARLQRQRLADARGEPVTIAEQEEQQVQHDERVDDEVERVLSDRQRPRPYELQRLDEARRDALLDCAEIAQADAGEPRLQPRRQRVEDLLQVASGCDLARLHRLVQVHGFLQHQRRDERERQDHEQHDDRERDERSERAASAHDADQASLQRGEQYRDDGSPQHGAEERPQDPGERGRRGENQQPERSILDRAGRSAAMIPPRSRIA